MRLSLILRAVVIPLVAIIALIVLIRPNPYPHVPVLILATMFVLSVDLASLARGLLQNVLVGVAALCLGGATLEGVAEMMAPHVVQTTPGLWTRDPVLGTRASKPGAFHAEKTVDGQLAYNVSYTIDDKLHRLTRSPPDGPRVGFFGDSMTFGEGLNDADTLPQLFADKTGANVVNFGIPGYSPAQALRALQTGMYDKELAGSRLFILQTSPYHIERTSCFPDWVAGAPRYVTTGGKLELAGSCPKAPWQGLSVARAVQPALRQPKRQDVETYIAIVAAFADLTRSKYHVPLVIIDMSKGARYLDVTGFTIREVEDRFRAAGALVIDNDVPAPPDQDLTLPNDPHPNALANRLLADKLVAFVEKMVPAVLRPAR